MKNRILSAIALFGSVSAILAANPAHAASWRYISDGHGDSSDLTYTWRPTQSFDIRGMGMRVDDQDIWIGISANMHEGGHYTGGIYRSPSTGREFAIANHFVGWGDMFFDFSGRNSFEQAGQNRELFGIRFTPHNDTQVSTGVYRGVQGTSVQRDNAGFRNFGAVKSSLGSYGQSQMRNGELAYNDAYWGQYGGYRTDTFIANTIDTGAQRIGDVTFLDYRALYDNGFSTNPDGFGHGSFLFGFKFSRSLLPTGDFVASLFQECLNDTIAFRGRLDAPPPIQPPIQVSSPGESVDTPSQPDTAAKVPEPSALLGLGTVGLALVKRRFQR